MKYPEHENLQMVKDKSQMCGDFLEWLQYDKKYIIAEYAHHHHCATQDDEPSECNCEQILVPAPIDFQRLLAEYFNIDYDKLMDEKEQMVKELQQLAKSNKKKE